MEECRKKEEEKPRHTKWHKCLWHVSCALLVGQFFFFFVLIFMFASDKERN